MSIGSTPHRLDRVTLVPSDVIIDVGDNSDSDQPSQVQGLIDDWKKSRGALILNLTSTDAFTNADLDAIGRALPSLHQLAELQIGPDVLQRLTPAALESLGSGLATNASLHTLDLTLDSISPETARSLAVHIRGSESIKHLRIHGKTSRDVFPMLHFLAIPLEAFSASRRDHLGNLESLQISVTDCKNPPDSIHAVLDVFLVGHDALQSIAVLTNRGTKVRHYAVDGVMNGAYRNEHFANSARASSRAKMRSPEVLAATTKALFSTEDKDTQEANERDRRIIFPADVTGHLGTIVGQRISRERREFSGLLRTTKAAYNAATSCLSKTIDGRALRLLQRAALELADDEIKQMGSIVNPHLCEFIKEIAHDASKTEFTADEIGSVVALLRYLMKVEKKLVRKRQEAGRQQALRHQGRENRLRFCPTERPRNRTECLAAARQCITSTAIAVLSFICAAAVSAGVVALVWFIIEADCNSPRTRIPTPSPTM